MKTNKNHRESHNCPNNGIHISLFPCSFYQECQKESEIDYRIIVQYFYIFKKLTVIIIIQISILAIPNTANVFYWMSEDSVRLAQRRLILRDSVCKRFLPALMPIVKQFMGHRRIARKHDAAIEIWFIRQIIKARFS